MEKLHIFSIPALGPPGLDFSSPPPSQKHMDFLTETYQNEAFPAQGPPGPGFEVEEVATWGLQGWDSEEFIMIPLSS